MMGCSNVQVYGPLFLFSKCFVLKGEYWKRCSVSLSSISENHLFFTISCLSATWLQLSNVTLWMFFSTYTWAPVSLGIVLVLHFINKELEIEKNVWEGIFTLFFFFLDAIAVLEYSHTFWMVPLNSQPLLWNYCCFVVPQWLFFTIVLIFIFPHMSSY